MILNNGVSWIKNHEALSSVEMKALNWSRKSYTVLSKCLGPVQAGDWLVPQTTPSQGGLICFSMLVAGPHLKAGKGFTTFYSLGTRSCWRGYFGENRRWRQRASGGRHRKCALKLHYRGNQQEEKLIQHGILTRNMSQRVWAQLEESPGKVLKMPLSILYPKTN